MSDNNDKLTADMGWVLADAAKDMQRRIDTQGATSHNFFNAQREWTATNNSLASEVTDLRAELRRVVALNNSLASEVTDLRAELRRVVALNDGACNEIIRVTDQNIVLADQRDQAQRVVEESQAGFDQAVQNLRDLCTRRYYTIREREEEIAHLRRQRTESITVAAPVFIPDDMHREQMNAAVATIESLYKELRDAKSKRIEPLVIVSDTHREAADLLATKLETCEEARKVASVRAQVAEAELKRVRQIATDRYASITKVTAERDNARQVATNFAAALDNVRDDAEAIVKEVSEHVRPNPEGMAFPTDIEHWFG